MINDVIKKIDKIATIEPNRIAYDYLSKTNTYGDLKRRSDAWAHKIISLNLPTDSPIMVWGGQDFEMIASFLGCVKAGHAYIPIASYSNAERIAMIQEVAKAKVILAIDALPEINLTGLQVIKPSEVMDGTFEIDSQNFVAGDANFYIIFTSGTSGLPKGVQISHNNLLSFINWEMTDFALPDYPSFLSQAPYSFDLSVMSLYPALVSGGKLVVLPHDVTENFSQLFLTLPKLKFNVWVSTPSFAQMCFLDKTFDEKHHPEMTHFLFCGEELPHGEALMLKQKFPHAKIFNTYGPTETTVAVTQVEITDEILNKYDRLPIGRAKADTKITIDETKGDHNQGEIIIEGPSTSKGYMNNSEKTAKAFFKKPGAKYISHRSGDEGFLDNGMLFYRGRIDFQIKFNGYRIELEEINHYIGKNEFVDYGVVAPKYGKDHTVKQLVAEIKLKDGIKERYSEAEITKAIRADLAKNLMPYMIPQRFVYRETLPISQNGKVDIKAVIKEVNE
ncbi:D-alanine--poly(phosphoribitol) ligase subunit DltA [Lactobacillus bombicola]|jgi:D-alanine--poly(phosphoribitol) ligase subunit 1|uniref:D-alanine--D-alanyl carrier protein ligase n=1 Tax=Lactobacillus bombicola TaxID=1505723 RepID=A0A396SQ89_9LACO|nr:D-alanine--poly(phosphoribitol) ligase subunit DltA [Lactobacillus bombicola]RHW50379.1 D-alanine--poly(phosphoribitol) ligase subunit 1 [Lactobacillus bombicola]RHW53817.1 D-alanine--poly(phosphoribitol) ligase subunit 1 [Lactobacillus bombicola]